MTSISSSKEGPHHPKGAAPRRCTCTKGVRFGTPDLLFLWKADMVAEWGGTCWKRKEKHVGLIFTFSLFSCFHSKTGQLSLCRLCHSFTKPFTVLLIICRYFPFGVEGNKTKVNTLHIHLWGSWKICQVGKDRRERGGPVDSTCPLHIALVTPPSPSPPRHHHSCYLRSQWSYSDFEGTNSKGFYSGLWEQWFAQWKCCLLTHGPEGHSTRPLSKAFLLKEVKGILLHVTSW